MGKILPDYFPTPHSYPPFKEIEPIAYASCLGLLGLSAGLFSACVKNAYWSTTNSALTVLTTYGSAIPIYGAIHQELSLIIGAAFGAYGLTKAMLQNQRQKVDGWNEFWGAASGAALWSIFSIYSIVLELLTILGGQKLTRVVAYSSIAAACFGIYSWSGGIGGWSTIAGVDFRKGLEYRRNWKYYPTNKIPLEDYEEMIGRKVNLEEDFNDLIDIFGMGGPPTKQTVAPGYHPAKKDPNEKEWWQEVLEKARAEAKEKKEKK